jgi:hypothetical protein
VKRDVPVEHLVPFRITYTRPARTPKNVDGDFKARLLARADQWERDARQVESDGEQMVSSLAWLEKAEANLRRRA